MVDDLKEKFKKSPIYRLETLILGLALLFGFLGAYLQIQRKASFEEELRNKYKTQQVLTLIKKLCSKNAKVDVLKVSGMLNKLHIETFKKT